MNKSHALQLKPARPDKHLLLRLTVIALALLWVLPSCNRSSTQSVGEKFPSDSLDESMLFTDPDSSLESVEEMNALERENWQKPQVVISRLGDLSDKVVADIGAGTGYFTMRLARKARKVIAIDIEQEFLDYIERRLARTRDRDYLNVETRLTQPDDPRLQPGEADLVLVVNTYPYIGDRINYFSKVHSGMKPKGQLVIVDFKKTPLPVGPPVEEKISADSILHELKMAGFAPLKIDSSSLSYQYTIHLERQ